MWAVSFPDLGGLERAAPDYFFFLIFVPVAYVNAKEYR